MSLRAIRRVVRRFAQAVARALPGTRGRALVAGGRAAFTLVTGRPTGDARRKAARAARRERARARQQRLARAATYRRSTDKRKTHSEDDRLTDALREEVEQAERAVKQGQHAEAAVTAGRLAARLPLNHRVHQLHAAALAGGDDAAALALALHRLHVIRDDAAVHRRERTATGRVATLSRGWLPRVPRDSQPFAAPSADAVLVLARESEPYSSTPLTERVSARLRELAAMELRPQVITSLGFPRATGVTDVRSVEDEDGVPHHRLDLGPFYPLDGSPDRRLNDAVWLALDLAREIRPGMLHAIIDRDGLEIALLAMALRNRLGVPLAYDIVGDLGDLGDLRAPSTDADRSGSDAASALSALSWALEDADAVVGSEDLGAAYASAAIHHGARGRT